MQVRVKHLLEYLASFDPEAEVHLDHDGWMEDDVQGDAPTELDVVKQRGLFEAFEGHLFINN